MKPRTNFQHTICRLNETLPPITHNVEEWAKNKVAKHYAYRLKSGKTTCLDCNHTFYYEGKAKHIKCPHCGRSLTVRDTSASTYKNKAFFSTLSVVESIQLQRVWQIHYKFSKSATPEYEIHEILRLWANEKGSIEVTARSRSMFSYCLDVFSTSSPIILRSMKPEYFVVADCDVYPYQQLAPIVKRNGIKNTRLIPASPMKAIKSVLTDNKIETLVKTGRYEEAGYFIYNPNALWPLIKIAMRHHYVIKDMKLWVDMISTMKHLGFDLKNPENICPQNLKQMHDKVTAQWNEVLKKQEEERKKVAERRKREEEILRKATEEQRLVIELGKESIFQKAKSKFFGIRIDEPDMTISVLDSIKAYKEEADEMQHCVFSNRYYEMENSVVLSAKDKNGKRIATIEFSLIRMKVVQCFGKYNSHPKDRERIVNLVNENAYQFEKAQKIKADNSAA